jgi:hypothetical protein
VPKKRLYAAVNELRKVLPVVLPAFVYLSPMSLLQAVYKADAVALSFQWRVKLAASEVSKL